MKQSTREAARLVWIPSFVAFYNTASLTKAESECGVAAKTIRDHVRQLELWLRRPLMDESSEVPCPTWDAKEFFPIALRILELSIDPQFATNIKTARITPDGVLLDHGEKLASEIAAEIAKLLSSFRASLIGTKPFAPSPRVDPRSIDITSRRYRFIFEDTEQIPVA